MLPGSLLARGKQGFPTSQGRKMSSLGAEWDPACLPPGAPLAAQRRPEPEDRARGWSVGTLGPCLQDRMAGKQWQGCAGSRHPPPLGLLGGVDADAGRTSGDRRRDTEEPGRQQVCYLSQSEGEDLASRPCRTRGCPRHEGTQGLRSLWVKRTELLRTGTGGPRRARHGHAVTERWGTVPHRQESSLSSAWRQGRSVGAGG